ncbi:hypothetical protein LO772_04980 [Yinghuangia sp. ASG 101]|uniref:hypothetical protein n=1 Tax=Yinghuangia sp. ASG 101 TaxID=2896848 RepID=UPI001E5D6AB9|nr:hypothetical protein [Yinghuangia sp. ASG 101]UGQ12979.1 hypothetical protein LO772_04980 [Yinghuangia sp. ASG 101]
MATSPGRLRTAVVALCVLVLAFGVTAAWQANARARAADRLMSDSGPLSQDAAEIYRSLADADTTAAGGFLLAANEPAAIRERYEKDLTTAGDLLTRAAARADESSEAQHWIASLNKGLPVYAGLVEAARANNRQGFPLGGAYLRYASDYMQNTLLPDAELLVDSESRRLADDFDDAEAYPWAAAGLGAVALAALVVCQVKLYRRTHRVFNLGLVGATAAVLATGVWLVVGFGGAASSLGDSRTRGAEPLRVLNQARFDALQAHAAENLNLVARGASSAYTKTWDKEAASLAGTPGQPGQFEQAEDKAPASAAALVADARGRFADWRARHDAAAAKDTEGDYSAALAQTISADPNGDTADAAYAEMDALLSDAALIEQREFASAAKGVDDDLRLLALGALVLMVPALYGAVRGIGPRLAEYR